MQPLLKDEDCISSAHQTKQLDNNLSERLLGSGVYLPKHGHIELKTMCSHPQENTLIFRKWIKIWISLVHYSDLRCLIFQQFLATFRQLNDHLLFVLGWGRWSRNVAKIVGILSSEGLSTELVRLRNHCYNGAKIKSANLPGQSW